MKTPNELLAPHREEMNKVVQAIDREVSAELTDEVNMRPHADYWDVQLSKSSNAMGLLQQSVKYKAYQNFCHTKGWSVYCTSSCEDYIVLRFTPIDKE